MEGLIQVGILVLVALGIVVLALLIPVVVRLRRTVAEAERTIVELRGQALPAIQGLPPAIQQLQSVLDTTDTILKDTHTALMPAVKQAGAAMNDELIPSVREALVVVKQLIKVVSSLLAKVERIDKLLGVVDTVTRPREVTKVVKSVSASPLVRPGVWVEALKRGYAVLKGKQEAETPPASEGSKDTVTPPVGEMSEEQRGGDDHVGQ